MWTPLKTEVLDRFAAVESFFKATRGLGGDIEQNAKGLAFVQMYAAYEYTARTVVRSAVDSIIAHKHRNHDLIPTLMALFLDPELTSVRDCSRGTLWASRIKMFEKLFSRSPAKVHNTVFPNDGNHFRRGQLQTIFDVLGIKRSPAQRRRHLVRIDEVVDHRNAIARGEETAAHVGSRYTRTEVLDIMRQVRSVWLLLITAIERHCADKRRHSRKP